jgi:hypothetical protein
MAAYERIVVIVIWWRRQLGWVNRHIIRPICLGV